MSIRWCHFELADFPAEQNICLQLWDNCFSAKGDNHYILYFCTKLLPGLSHSITLQIALVLPHYHRDFGAYVELKKMCGYKLFEIYSFTCGFYPVTQKFVLITLTAQIQFQHHHMYHNCLEGLIFMSGDFINWILKLNFG